MMLPADFRLRQLAQLCQPGLKWKWRTWPQGGQWHAELKCGYEDGAFPIWTDFAATEIAALDRVIGAAVHYWEGTSDRARRLKDINTGMIDLFTISDDEVLAIYLDTTDPEHLTELEQAALDEIERRGLDF